MSMYEYKYFPVYYIARKKMSNRDYNISQMIPFEKGKVFNTRKDRINRWSSGKGLVPALFCKNDVISGFKIEGFTYSPMAVINSSMGGWHISDPRGFTVDVSHKNLQEILNIASINKGGQVANDAIWGRLGGENWLAIKGSESYVKINAMKNATEKNKKEKIKVLAGDSVVLKNGKKGVYLGGLFPLINDYWSEDETKKIKWGNKYHFFLMKKGSNIEWKVRAYSGLNVLSKLDEEIWNPPLNEKACNEILKKSINGDKDFQLYHNMHGKLVNLHKVKAKIKSIFFKRSKNQNQKYTYSYKPYYRDKLSGQVFRLGSPSLMDVFKSGGNMDNIKQSYYPRSTFLMYYFVDSIPVEDEAGRYTLSVIGKEKQMGSIKYSDTEFIDQFVELENGDILLLGGN